MQDALRGGIATKPELLAAGYNSNPMRLPTYLKNGGSGWRTLIPGETQMYLAIYRAVDNNVQFDAPGTTDALTDNTTSGDFATVATTPRIESMTSWLTTNLLAGGSALVRFLP